MVEKVQGLLHSFFAEEVTCSEVAGYVACDMMVTYPDNDIVSVYVVGTGNDVKVTDFSEGYRYAVNRPHLKQEAIRSKAVDICSELGVTFRDGRAFAETELDELGDAAWRVAEASSRIGQIGQKEHSTGSDSRTTERFADEVTDQLEQRKVAVHREHQLVGGSGWEYDTTIFLPDTESVIEPIVLTARSSVRERYVYSQFGDLRRANGYSLLSVIDDREKAIEDTLQSLLMQVSDLVFWSEPSEWLAHVGGN